MMHTHKYTVTVSNFNPGDLVFRKKHWSSSITCHPGGHDEEDNHELGELTASDVALIVQCDHDHIESLILTSTGLLGWISNSSLDSVQ